MEKVTIERKVAMWDELTAERKESEIEKLTFEKGGLQVFFDGAYCCYKNALRDIENETLQEDPVKYTAVKFVPDKVHWQSGSQGWYYDHCSPPDFLVYKEVYKNTKRYCLELRDVDTYHADRAGRWGYDHSFEWYLSITETGITHEYSGEFADIETAFERNGLGIPAAAIRLVKKHEKQYRDEFEELKKRVEDEIRSYDGYWPNDAEIGEYFRLNEIEFVISEDEVERVAI
jgi:hypothetical protein